MPGVPNQKGRRNAAPSGHLYIDIHFEIAPSIAHVRGYACIFFNRPLLCRAGSTA